MQGSCPHEALSCLFQIKGSMLWHLLLQGCNLPGPQVPSECPGKELFSNKLSPNLAHCRTLQLSCPTMGWVADFRCNSGFHSGWTRFQCKEESKVTYCSVLFLHSVNYKNQQTPLCPHQASVEVAKPSEALPDAVTGSRDQISQEG